MLQADLCMTEGRVVCMSCSRVSFVAGPSMKGGPRHIGHIPHCPPPPRVLK